MLFRRNGYAATGTNEIVAVSGAPKGSLYHYFPAGKAEIAAEAVTYAGGVVEATLKALASPPEHLPQMKQFEPTPTQRFNADALWAVVQCMASGMQIDPSLVSSRQEIIDLLRAIDAKSPTDDIGLLQGWRAGAIGSKLMKLFDGQGTLSLQYQKQQLLASTSDVG